MKINLSRSLLLIACVSINHTILQCVIVGYSSTLDHSKFRIHVWRNVQVVCLNEKRITIVFFIILFFIKAKPLWNVFSLFWYSCIYLVSLFIQQSREWYRRGNNCATGPQEETMIDQACSILFISLRHFRSVHRCEKFRIC